MKNLLNGADLDGVKAVLIDLDNTLCNTEDYYDYALECCYLKFKKEIKNISFVQFKMQYKEAQEMLKKNTKGQAASHSRLIYFQILFENYFGKTRIDLALEFEKLYYQSVFAKTKLYKETKEFLSEIKKRKIKICIITDQVASLQFKKIKFFKLDKYIDFVVTSEEAGVEKPNPTIFHIALAKLKLKPKEVVVIGDSYDRDIQGATNAGIKRSYLFNHSK